MSYIKQVGVPSFPTPPKLYDDVYQGQLLNVLRLYLLRTNTNLSSIFGDFGGRFFDFPYGSFYDTTDQTAASTSTAYAITLNSTAASNGIVIRNSSQITFEYTGIYNIQFSLQLVNFANSPEDIDVWFRKNGTDLANSNTRFGLAARKSSSDPFHTVAALNFIVSAIAGDYVQLMWCSTEAFSGASTGAYIEHYNASSSPTRPAIPSAIVTATFISQE